MPDSPNRTTRRTVGRLRGGCACGAVRYELQTTPICVQACHCRNCQRLTGSAFSINALIETDRIRGLGATAPEAIETWTTLPDAQTVMRCPSCRVRVWTHHADMGLGIALVHVGTLDEPSALEPEVHSHTASKHWWIHVPDDVPAFPGNYEPRGVWSDEAKERVRAARR